MEGGIRGDAGGLRLDHCCFAIRSVTGTPVGLRLVAAAGSSNRSTLMAVCEGAICARGWRIVLEVGWQPVDRVAAQERLRGPGYSECGAAARGLRARAETTGDAAEGEREGGVQAGGALSARMSRYPFLEIVMSDAWFASAGPSG
ncbi:hypothetical protein D3C84_838360 [compost metagenome]